MIWSDIATWVGPTANRTEGGMASPPRGLVLHIASGFYDGTISWQRQTGASRTSSHFIVARDGRAAQMVDTADASWAQRSGNGTWLSVELEGFAPDDGLHASHPGWETATPQQIEVCARLLARAHQVYGVPLQLASSPSGRGLGHHSMGAESGTDWGHSLCPGTAIKAQKPTILARAQQLAAGAHDDEGDDMGASFGPVQLEQGTTSLVIPPVQAGIADPRPTWLNVGADSFDEAYRLRIWGSNGDGNFYPLGNAVGVHTLHSGVVLSIQLPQYLRLVTVTRQAIGAPDEPNGTPSAGGGEPAPEPQPYAGSISVCFERS